MLRAIIMHIVLMQRGPHIKIRVYVELENNIVKLMSSYQVINFLNDYLTVGI